MGTYKQICITANTKNTITICAIKNIMEKHEALNYFNSFGPSTRWWPEYLVVALCKAFPKIMFRVEYLGGYSGVDFHLDGKKLNQKLLISEFPTVSKFEKAFNTKLKRDTVRQKAAMLDNQQRLEQERKRKIVELEAKLNKLKAS